MRRLFILLAMILLSAVVLAGCFSLPTGNGGADSGGNSNGTGNSGSSEHQHDLKVVIINATCTEGGSTGYVCECGYTNVVSKTEPLGHTEQAVDAVEPTCTETGLTRGYKCSRCNAVTKEQEVVPANGHSYSGVGCTVCNYKTGSAGLEFRSSENEDCYYLTGYGTCRDKDVVIPHLYNGLPVTDITTGAFQNVATITSVTIPEGVVSIPKHAFYDCRSLVSVTIPDSVVSIGEGAFSRCESLTSVTIPEGIKVIEQDAFLLCGNMTEITLPKSIEKIKSGAFGCNYKITRVNVPDLETWFNTEFEDLDSNPIYNGALYIGGKAVTEITVPAGVSEIKSYSLARYSELTGINLGGNVKSIGTDAFYQCTKLESIDLAGVQSIGTRAFYECNAIVEVHIPKSVSNVSPQAFCNCWNFTAYTVDSGNEYYKDIDGVLYSADGKSIVSYPKNRSGESYDIPDGVTVILDYAFSGAKFIRNLTVSASVESIGKFAFSGCDRLTAVNILGNNLRTIGNNAFAASYLNEINIPDGVISIGDSAFISCDRLKRITLPSSLTSLGKEAFKSCESLESAIFENCAVEIKDYTFHMCDSLATLELGDAITSIGEGAFRKCISLTSIVIPDSVTKIGTLTFDDCVSLEYVTIGSGVHSIPSRTFKYCIALKEVVIKEGVEVIHDYAFVDCYGAVGLTIPDSVTKIGNYAFQNWTKLISLNIGSGVTSIGNHAFDGCTNLKDVTMGNSVTSIGAYAFNKCTYLSSVSFSEKLEKIGDYAFYECTHLVTVVFGDELNEIGIGAFANCSNLDYVTFGTSVLHAKENAFLGALVDNVYITDIAAWCASTFDDSNATPTRSSQKFYLLKDGVAEEIKNLVIPTGTQTISSYAFYRCWNIQSVVIPESVTSIRAAAFLDCYQLREIYYCGGEAEWENLRVGGNNDYFNTSDLYFFSDTEPTEDGNFWHYGDNGEIAKW